MTQENAVIANTLIVPVILCGGSGTRLWPASRENHPKQFLSLMDDFSLLQNTMRRTLRACGAEASSVVVVTLGAMKNSVIEQLCEIHPDAAMHILCEPSARNTAAAVAFAADYVANTFGEDAIMWILPADHHIANEQILSESFGHALVGALDGNLVTFGINPTRPDTGYGYISVGDANYTGHIHGVKEFVEKPNRATAQMYLDSGDYLWNSGMFLFTAKTVLEQYNIFARKILADIRIATVGNAKEPQADMYAKIESQPFDKAIMEKSTNVAVVPCNPEWSDIGSWESLWDIREKDANENVIEGKAVCVNAKGCLVQAQDRLVTVAGLDNVVVVETADAILIINKSDADSMRDLVKGLKGSGAREVIDIPKESRAQPWTMVKSIPSERALQASEIVIAAGEKKMFKAQEAGICLYTVMEGSASIAYDGQIKKLKAFESINIPATLDYVIANAGKSDLKMIEVHKSDAEGIFFGAANDARKVA